jgi:hypothetical protein
MHTEKTNMVYEFIEKISAGFSLADIFNQVQNLNYNEKLLKTK